MTTKQVTFPYGRSILPSTVGFDRLISTLEELDEIFTNGKPISYPPYNIIKYDETHYEIELAVAGFDRSDLRVIVDQDQLFISGEHSKVEDDSILYIHRGLASRNFERTFTLPQYMEVTNVSLTNGILSVKLHHEIPNTLKPRKLQIQ